MLLPIYQANARIGTGAPLIIAGWLLATAVIAGITRQLVRP